jgi:hypothetical protein
LLFRIANLSSAFRTFWHLFFLHQLPHHSLDNSK